MIVFNVQGGGAGVALTAEQLDNVMGGLAGIPSQMTPEVPQSFDLEIWPERTGIM